MRMNLSQKIGVMQSVTSRIACEKKVLKEVIREMFGEQRSDCAKKKKKKRMANESKREVNTGQRLEFNFHLILLKQHSLA